MKTCQPPVNFPAATCAKAISLVALAALSGLSVVVCGGSTDIQEPRRGGSTGDNKPQLGAPTQPQAPSDPLNEPWMLIQPCSASAPFDSVAIEAVKVTGSRLTVNIAHGGGCEAHSYGLCYSQDWAESAPVQIGLKFMHDAHNDLCDAYLSTSLIFDLGPLEEEYQRAYQTESGSMRLSLGDQSFVHTFGSEPLKTWEQIHAEIDRLNTCETVTDCHAIATEACSQDYVNASADITELQESIQARRKADYGDEVACDTACACGALSCQEGKCVTAASDCESGAASPDTQMICL